MKYLSWFIGWIAHLLYFAVEMRLDGTESRKEQWFWKIIKLQTWVEMRRIQHVGLRLSSMTIPLIGNEKLEDRIHDVAYEVVNWQSESYGQGI